MGNVEYRVYPYNDTTKVVGLNDDNPTTNGEYHAMYAFLKKGDVLFDVGCVYSEAHRRCAGKGGNGFGPRSDY